MEDTNGVCSSDSSSSGEKVLADESGWREEAAAVVGDVRECVDHIAVAERLQNSNSCVFLNLTTKEQLKRTIKLTAAGFAIVGLDHDRTDQTVDDEEAKFYETPYALLSDISPAFTQSFGNSLADRLSQLASSQEDRR